MDFGLNFCNKIIGLTQLVYKNFFKKIRVSSGIIICVLSLSNISSLHAYSTNYKGDLSASSSTSFDNLNRKVATHSYQLLPVGTKVNSIAGAREQEVGGIKVYIYRGNFFVKLESKVSKAGINDTFRYMSINPPVGVLVRSIPESYKKIYVKNKLFYKVGDTYYKYNAITFSYEVVANPIYRTSNIKSQEFVHNDIKQKELHPVIKKAVHSAISGKKDTENKKELHPLVQHAISKSIDNKKTSENTGNNISRLNSSHFSYHQKLGAKQAHDYHHSAPITHAPETISLPVKSAHKIAATSKVKSIDKTSILLESKSHQFDEHNKLNFNHHKEKMHEIKFHESLKVGDVVDRLPSGAHVKYLHGVQFSQFKGILYLPSVGSNNQVVYVVVKIK